MRIYCKNVEYRLSYRFPWEFIFIAWKLRHAIKVWAHHAWTDEMRDLWSDKGCRFLGIEFMKRIYARTKRN